MASRRSSAISSPDRITVKVVKRTAFTLRGFTRLATTAVMVMFLANLKAHHNRQDRKSNRTYNPCNHSPPSNYFAFLVLFSCNVITLGEKKCSTPLSFRTCCGLCMYIHHVLTSPPSCRRRDRLRWKALDCANHFASMKDRNRTWKTTSSNKHANTARVLNSQIPLSLLLQEYTESWEMKEHAQRRE